MDTAILKRNAELSRMGFDSYEAYLRSELWLGIRAKIFAARPNCELCGAPAQCVHHQHYGRKTLTGKTLQNLKPLCHSCHRYIEFEENGRKTSFRIVRFRYRVLADKFRHPLARRNRAT